MLGYLLAASIIVNCTVVNFDPQPTLTCSDRQTRTISYSDWPEVWHGPELGFTYTLLDGKPVMSLRGERALTESIRRSREHQLRWMREPLQNPRRKQ